MFRHSTRPLGALVGIALTVLFATGCAAGAAPQGRDAAPVPDDQIASLETAAPEKTATEDPLIAEYGEPVRLRLDMTDEESEAAWQPRERCLADRMPKATITGGQDSGVGVATNDDPVAAAEAEAFCMKFAPLPPHELDAQNPDALRFAQLVVDCLREHGVREVEITDADEFGRINFALGGESNDSTSISLGMQHTESCMATASERSDG